MRHLSKGSSGAEGGGSDQEVKKVEVETDEEGNIIRTVTTVTTSTIGSAGASTTSLVEESSTSSSSTITKSQVEKKLESWGKPLGLPSPMMPGTPRKAGSKVRLSKFPMLTQTQTNKMQRLHFSMNWSFTRKDRAPA